MESEEERKQGWSAWTKSSWTSDRGVGHWTRSEMDTGGYDDAWPMA